ncbi:hypothetical protein [Haloferula sp. BvORR071]|uniref:hypothetical protein n=1 Tax=Haloferula sp. BvORR071 TaxID=1396141 RepID=UPI000556C5E5|nr:hypothetical protein [Haloferula sp. BvORR071]
MRRLSLLLALLSVSPAPLLAEVREWKNAEGTQSFNGEYVSHSSTKVTIRRQQDGKVVTLDLARLNDADKIWLTGMPMTDEGKPAAERPAEAEGKAPVFDTLNFGDKREEVEKKLKASKLVESSVDPELMGRVGLNGSYHTRKQIGGLHCDLYFDWTGAGTLKEVNLQTQSVPKEVYVNRLKATWQELAELLTALHGKPVQAGPFPPAATLKADTLVPSHLWKLEGGGSAMLGTSSEGDTCMIVVRFTTEKIRPVATP